MAVLLCVCGQQWFIIPITAFTGTLQRLLLLFYGLCQGQFVSVGRVGIKSSERPTATRINMWHKTFEAQLSKVGQMMKSKNSVDYFLRVFLILNMTKSTSNLLEGLSGV